MRPRSGLMRLFGLLAERQPPWFHEGHFLKPAGLRQFYLHILRRMSGAMPLPQQPAREGGAWRKLSCDVLVVGGGVAGLSAAAAVRAAGQSVIVVDSARPFVRPDQARHAAGNLAVDTGCIVLADTLCVGLYEEPRRALCVDGRGTIVIEHAQLVVATGAYDRMLPFPNNDLPGIVGVRALEALLAQQAVPGDWTIGVYGEVSEVERALRALQDSGRKPRWVAGPAALPAAAVGVDSYPDTLIERAQGRRRIGGVQLSRAGRLTCDLLVLGFSQPGYELQMQRLARLEVQGHPSKLVPDVSQTGLLVVGAAAGDTDADTAAQAASQRAQEWLRSGSSPPPHSHHVSQTQMQQPHPDAFICPCEDVRIRDIQQAVRDGYADIELVKRRTGAATGPCQGKLCHGNLVDCLTELGVEARLPTQRPLVRPVRFSHLAGAAEE